MCLCADQWPALPVLWCWGGVVALSTAVTEMWDFSASGCHQRKQDPPQRPDPQTEQEVCHPKLYPEVLQVRQKMRTETRSPGHPVGFERDSLTCEAKLYTVTSRDSGVQNHQPENHTNDLQRSIHLHKTSLVILEA